MSFLEGLKRVTGTNEESGTCLILQGVTNEVWRDLVFFGPHLHLKS